MASDRSMAEEIPGSRHTFMFHLDDSMSGYALHKLVNKLSTLGLTITLHS